MVMQQTRSPVESYEEFCETLKLKQKLYGEKKQARVQKWKENLEEWRVVRNLRSNAQDEMSYVIQTLYNRGDAIETLYDKVTHALRSYEEWYPQAVELDKQPEKSGYSNELASVFIIGYSLFLQTFQPKDDSLMPRMANMVHSGQCLLVDRFWSQFAPRSEIAKELAYPKATKLLYDMIDAPVPIASKMMRKYLETYGDLSYDGSQFYFCYQLGAIVKAFKLDDSEIANHPNYPYELVHWQAA